MKKTNEIALGKPYFNAIGNDVIFIDNQNKIASISNGVLIDGTFYNFTFFRGKIWATDNNDTTSRVYLYPEVSTLTQFEYLVSPRLDIFCNELSNFIICLCRDITGKFWTKLDISTFEVHGKYPIKYGLNGFWKVLNDSFFLSIKDSMLSCHSLEEGNQIWLVDITEIFAHASQNNKHESIQKLMTFGDLLVIESTGISLLGIDIHTGQVLWIHQFDKRFFFTSSQEGAKIHAFHFGTYHEIDIKTGELLQTKSLEADFKSFGFSIVGHTAPAVSEKYIALASSFEANAVILDRENLQIIQRRELSGNYVPQTNTPKFHDNRLYILDAHNNLHIFEDE